MSHASHAPWVVRRQRVLFGLAVLSAALTAILTWSLWFANGTFGAQFVPSGVPFVDVIDVEPGLPAARAGVRAGDSLDIRDLSAADRLRWRAGPTVGETIVLPIRRGAARLHVAVTAVALQRSRFWRSDGWDQVLSDVGFLLSSLIAALIVWRRPESVEASLLASTLIVSDLTNAISATAFWISPWPALDFVLYTISEVYPLSMALFAMYSLEFGRPVSAFRRRLVWGFVALAGMSVLLGAGGSVGEWLGIVDSQSWFFAQTAVSVPLQVVLAGVPLFCAGLAYRDAALGERPRLAWAAGSMSVVVVFAGIYSVGTAFGEANHFEIVAVDVADFVTPLGLAYALLNRRLLDVGFVLNRAAVFTAITLFVLCAFTLAEWALGSWLQSASRTTNLVVSALLALALGLSIHPIHGAVDRLIDRLFFRKRHEDEGALRRLAHEAAFITDATTLIARTKTDVGERTGATLVTLLLGDGDGRYGGIDENDPALVALRAFGDPLDLRGVATALVGDRAYPMLARGRLIGALVVGPKGSGEAYAPDESSALAEVAHGVGVALDLHGIGRNEPAGDLAASLERLGHAIDALPEAIARRLNGRLASPERRSDAGAERARE